MRGKSSGCSRYALRSPIIGNDYVAYDRRLPSGEPSLRLVLGWFGSGLLLGRFFLRWTIPRWIIRSLRCWLFLGWFGFLGGVILSRFFLGWFGFLRRMFLGRFFLGWFSSLGLMFRRVGRRMLCGRTVARRLFRSTSCRLVLGWFGSLCRMLRCRSGRLYLRYFQCRGSFRLRGSWRLSGHRGRKIRRACAARRLHRPSRWLCYRYRL